MNMDKHTPAPWHLVETESGIDAEMDVFVTTPRYAGGTALIARVTNADDALLIAAAPNLLKGMKRIAKLLDFAYANLLSDNFDHDFVVGCVAEAKAIAEGDESSFDNQGEAK